MSDSILFASAAAAPLLMRAQEVLGMTHDTFGRRFGASKRTSGRWRSGESAFQASSMRQLVPLVFSRDPALAEELAATIGESLLSMGLRPAPGPPGPPAQPAVDPMMAIEAIVCTFADVANTTPKRARAGIVAAMRRARELGLSLEELEKKLTE